MIMIKISEHSLVTLLVHINIWLTYASVLGTPIPG